MRRVLAAVPLSLLALLLLVAAFTVRCAPPASAQVPSYTVRWTAPGDDGMTGRASMYSLRWSLERPDTTHQDSLAAWWRRSFAVLPVPFPSVAGALDSAVAAPPGGFASGDTVFFLIRAADEVPNWNDYSNVGWRHTPDRTKPGRITDLGK